MEKEIRNDIKGIDRFVFEAGSDREQLHLHISEVGPGQRAHPPHTHGGQEIFYVFSGEGEVLFGERTHRVSDNEAVHVDFDILPQLKQWDS